MLQMENEIVRVGTSGSTDGENENDPSKMGRDGRHELDYVEKEWGWDGRDELYYVKEEWGWDGGLVLREILDKLGKERLHELDEIEEELGWDGRHMLGITEMELDWMKRRIVQKIEYELKYRRMEQPSSTPDPFIFDDIPETLNPSTQAATHYEPYKPSILFLGFNYILKGRFDAFKYQKLKCVETFLERDQRYRLDDVVKFVQYHFGKIKDCYSFKIDYSLSPLDDAVSSYRHIYEIKFVKRMEHIEYLVKNIIFVIELFLRAYHRDLNDEVDSVVSHPLKKHDILQHLIMVQNQLPFFILRNFYNHAFASNPKPSFLLLTCHFFASFSSQKFSRMRHVLSTRNTQCADFIYKLQEAKHFTDFLRTLQLPCYSDTNQIDEDVSLCCKFFSIIKCIPGKIFTSLCSSARLNREKKDEDNLEEGRGEYLYNVALLREAGVKFRVNGGGNLCDIQFDENNGKMIIPPLIVDYSTELLFRNLMVWELMHYPLEKYICSYVLLMRFLIKSKEDVDILVQKRIIINQLGSHDEVVTLFYDLCKGIKLEKNFYYRLFQKLNAYNAVRHHSWIAVLKLNYFSTLWTGVATVAAIFLLVLTLIQTICSIISITPGH